MRRAVLIGLAGLTLAAGIQGAEARGRLRFGGMWVRRPTASLRVVPGAPELAARPDIGAGARPTYVVLPPPGAQPDPSAARAAVGAAAPAPQPAAKAVAETPPWCRSRRVVGSGAGFCEVN